MRRQEVIDRLRTHRDDLDSYGVQSISLFGSVARGREGPASDVDVLVEFGGPPTFDQYMGLKLYLEDLLGTSVDVVTPRSLRDRVREKVLEEAVRVA